MTAKPRLLFTYSLLHWPIEICNNTATDLKIKIVRLGDCRVGGVNSKPNNTSVLKLLPKMTVEVGWNKTPFSLKCGPEQFPNDSWSSGCMLLCILRQIMSITICSMMCSATVVWKVCRKTS